MVPAESSPVQRRPPGASAVGCGRPDPASSPPPAIRRAAAAFQRHQIAAGRQTEWLSPRPFSGAAASPEMTLIRSAARGSSDRPHHREVDPPRQSADTATGAAPTRARANKAPPPETTPTGGQTAPTAAAQSAPVRRFRRTAGPRRRWVVSLWLCDAAGRSPWSPQPPQRGGNLSWS